MSFRGRSMVAKHKHYFLLWWVSPVVWMMSLKSFCSWSSLLCTQYVVVEIKTKWRRWYGVRAFSEDFLRRFDKQMTILRITTTLWVITLTCFENVHVRFDAKNRDPYNSPHPCEYNEWQNTWNLRQYLLTKYFQIFCRIVVQLSWSL